MTNSLFLNNLSYILNFEELSVKQTESIMIHIFIIIPALSHETIKIHNAIFKVISSLQQVVL